MKMPKIQNATVLRNHLFETLREVSEGDPQVITHKGGREVVLMSLDRYNRIIEENEFNKAAALGRAQIDQGQFVTHDQMTKELREMQKKWK